MTNGIFEPAIIALRGSKQSQIHIYLDFLAGLLELWGRSNTNDNSARVELMDLLGSNITKNGNITDWGTVQFLAKKFILTEDFPDASTASNMRSVFRKMAVEPADWETYVKEVRTTDSWNQLLENRGVRKSKKSGSTKSTAGQKINMTSGDGFKVTFPADTLPGSLKDESLCYVKRDPNGSNALLILGVYATDRASIEKIIGGKDNVLL